MTPITRDMLVLLERILSHLTEGPFSIFPGSLAHREIETVLERARIEWQTEHANKEGAPCQR